VAYDEQNPGGTVSLGKQDGLSDVYDVPTGLPDLEHPKIIVSLEPLTLHLFDRATGPDTVVLDKFDVSRPEEKTSTKRTQPKRPNPEVVFASALSG
jgi:hypothetical protein